MTSSSQAQEGNWSWLRDLQGWLKGLLLVAAVIFAYQPAWHAGFIWDDDEYVTHNRLLTAPDGLRWIWFSLSAPSQYFPLVYTVFRVEHAFWGMNPAGYHWVNILLHALNALLVWRLLKRLSVPGAWLAAAIFALHPVQVESVAWVTELKNVLSLFFVLWSLLMWIKFIETEPNPAWRFYGLGLIYYALALFSKATACTLPAALLLILWLKHKPINLARWMQIIPFIVMGLGMGLLAMWWEHYHQGTQGKLFSLSLLERILIASHAVWFYAGKLIWPVNLTFSYPRWTINPADPLAYGWLVAGVGIVAVIYFVRRWVGRGVEVGVLFYAATLSPMLGFIMLYTFRYSYVADHYQYVAMLGPTALAAAGIVLALRRFQQRSRFLEPVFCGALLLVLGVLTWRQARMYTDVETLWRTTLVRNPDSWLAQNNLGLLLIEQGHIKEGMEHCQKAIQINPNFPESLNNLGIALAHEGRYDEAIVNYHKALRLDPNDSNVLSNLGAALAAKGRYDEAIENYYKALRLDPDNFRALDNLGVALAEKGRYDEAIVNFRKALQLNPDSSETLSSLGAALTARGQFEEAIESYDKALRLNPNEAATLDKLGIALADNGQLDDAIESFRKVLQLNPDDVATLDNLGMALDAKGRFDEAVKSYRQAIQLDSNNPGTHFHLAVALGRSGRTREAIAQYREALKLNPDLAVALNNLAWALATSPDDKLRDGAEAVRLAERACELTRYGEPSFLGTLAAAYAEAGRFPEAVSAAEKAEQLASARGLKKLAEADRQRLELYRAGRPYHEPVPTGQ